MFHKLKRNKLILELSPDTTCDTCPCYRNYGGSICLARKRPIQPPVAPYDNMLSSEKGTRPYFCPLKTKESIFTLIITPK